MDERSLALLQDGGWRVMQVWECALRGRRRRPLNDVVDRLTSWLTTIDDDAVGDIAGAEAIPEPEPGPKSD